MEAGKWLVQQRLRDPHMRINAAGIDDADAAARDRCDDKSAIFASGRKQLNRVARPNLEGVGQARTDDDRVRVVAKIIEASGDNLLGQIGGLEMESGLDAEKVDGGVLESGPRAERSAQDRRAGGDIGELPADSHDFPRVRDSRKIMSPRLAIRR